MRLFAPSYQIPAGWADNCAYMAHHPAYRSIEGVELLLFRYDDEDRSLFRADWPRITELRERFSYSLHLPDPLQPRHEPLFELTADLLEGAVMHLPAGKREAEEALRLRESFGERYGVPIAVENAIDRPAREIDTALPLCLNCGHALLAGEDPARVAAESGNLAEVHLHALREGRDHAPLHAGLAWLAPLLAELAGREIRTVIELFGEEELLESLALIEEVRSR